MLKGGIGMIALATATLIGVPAFAQSPQSITFTTQAPTTAANTTSFTVAATASSGLTVAITTSGICSGSGSGSATILMTSGSGTCSVIANQAGNGSYSAAPTLTESVSPTPYFIGGNLVVAVAGCGVYGGTCATPPVGGTGTGGTYGDDQAAPWTLFQYRPNGASSVTFVNSLQLPQTASGANSPVSDDFGSQSEGTIQLSGNGTYMTMMGYGINAVEFNVNYLLYCPGSTDASDACVPENGNPATAQTGNLTAPVAGVSGTTAVPRVAVLIDANGNVNTSTVLYNIFDQNDARSAYTPDGVNIYVSGQGCKTCGPTPNQIPASGDPFDNTMGVYYTAVGATNNAPTPITGNDNGPTGCSTPTTCTASEDTRMVQIYNGTLYVSMDSKPGSPGYNRSYIGTLGDPPATSLFTCTGVGAGCGTGYGPYGPAEMPGFGNTGGTGKYTINTAGGNNNSNGNNLNAGLAINLSPQNFFFASPTVLYVADTGSPKNHSNGPDTVCTTDGTTDSATVGDGGLQKWILNPTVTATVASGSTTVTSATSGAFTQGEVGLPISGTGIPAGATITAVSSAGKTATISAAATGNGTSVTVSGWSLAYTLYNGLDLVLNVDCDPSNDNTTGTGATGLYGVTGVVNGGVATLYVTNYPNDDLLQTYLYGITDTLATTTMTSPGTAFTVLDTAPAGSVFRGVSFVPAISDGDAIVTTVPSGLTVTTSGSACPTSTFTTPLTQAWKAGDTCTLSVTTPQAGPTGVQYAFANWQDNSMATNDVVTAPSSTPTSTYTYTATFTTQYELTTAATTGGTVSAGGYFASGTSPTVTATPSAGYYFVNFTGTVTSASNPLSVLMNQPQSITANFLPLGTQTILFTTQAPGSAAYDSSFGVVATGGASGNPVTITTSGVCSGSGSGSATITMISGSGTCYVTANQAGDSTYSAATPVTEDVTATMLSGSGNISVTATSVASSIYPNQVDTLTATVTVTGAGGAPAGTGETVSFYTNSGTTLLGTGTLSFVDADDSSTTINITGSQLALGPNSITAVYVGDANYSSTTSTTRLTVTLLSPLVNFGSSAVGTAATGQTLSYTFTSAMTLTATPVNILTAGASGLDYAAGGTSTCTAATAYTAGQTCSVPVAYTPTAPGARAGAVTLFASGSTLPLMTWYLSGVGQSGAVTIDPGTVTPTTLTGTATPAGYGAAVDGAGNVYVVDNANNAVLELAAGTFSQSTVVSGLSAPTGVALDGAGNLYVTSGSSVLMVPNENGTLNAADQSTLNITGLASARGVAVDVDGDVYVADATNGDVVELSSLGVQTTIASGLTSPHGVAVDAAFNVYVATNNAVTQYPFGGGAAVPYGMGYNNPRGVAVDAAGAVYVADTGNSQIVRVNPGGATQATLLITGVSSPQGVAVDSSDNLYLTDPSILIQVNRTLAAQLNFPATNVDSTSTTEAVTVTDAGNEELQVSNLAISANFVSEPSGGTDCTSSTSLSAGGQCEIGVAFAPTESGTLTGSASLTDNALSNTASTQSVVLSGGASQVAQTITFSVPSSAAYNSSFTVAATGGASGNPVILTTSGVCSGGGSNSATITMTSGTGTCSVIANQAGNAEYAAAPQVTQGVPASKIAPTVTFTGAPVSAAYKSIFTVATTTNASTAASISASGGCSGSGSGSASITMTSGTTTCNLAASWAADNDYSATTATQSTTASPASQSITITTAAPGSAAYNSSFPVAATASSTLAVAIVGTGSCSGSGSGSASITMTSGTGTCSVSFSQAGNSNYSAATPNPDTESVSATPASQSITVTVPAPATATLKSSFTVVASSTSGLSVTFGSSGGCTNVNGTYTMASSGTKACTETMNVAGTTNYSAAPQVTESTSVAKAITPTVSFTGAPATATYASSFMVAASSNSSSSPTFTTTGPCTIDVTTLVVSMTSGTGTCAMTATWAANDVYTAASATQKTTAEKAASVITWANPAAITYGTPLSATQLDATANVAGTFVYTPAAGKVLTAGVQSLSVKFTPSSTSDYTTVTYDVDLTVNPVNTTATITKNTPNPSNLGQAVTVDFSVAQAITNATKPTGAVTVNASSGQSCTGTLSGGNGSCKITLSTAGSITLTAKYAGDANNKSSVSAGVAQTVK